MKTSTFFAEAVFLCFGTLACGFRLVDFCFRSAAGWGLGDLVTFDLRRSDSFFSIDLIKSTFNVFRKHVIWPPHRRF